ncbi:MAG: GAF domain-containing protein [Anaerolineae bacterium]|nr:GAF domain-containing protein [Anaerolineae bacterium]
MNKPGLRLMPHRQIPWPAIAEKLSRGYDQLGLLFGLILLLFILSLLSPHFRQLNNFMLILQEASFVGIVAAGQTLVILTGGIDLSVGSIVALTGIVAALLMTGAGPVPALPPYLAIAFALGVGALIGLGHGWLIAKRNMPPFIVTLVSLGILRGIALVITEGRTIHSLPDEFKWLSDASIGGIPMPGLIMLATFLILGYVLRNTKMGRYTYAIGGNETSARLSGVPVDRYKIYTYMLSGFLSALVGIILIARLDGAVYTHGEEYGLNSAAAVIIGGTSLSGGIGGVWGSLIGVLIMAVVQNGLVMLNIAYQWHGIVIGLIILLAVFFDMERRQARQSMSKVRTAGQTIAESTYLEGMVTQIIQLIESRFGSPYVRICLIDPKIDELVECRADGQAVVQTKSIAHRVKTMRRPVIVDDLSHRDGREIVPLEVHVQSAVAIPLISNEQMIGVLEVQSLVAHAFGPEAVKRLLELTQEIIAPLRDAWLLECGWLAEQTRNVLRHLWDDVYLGRSPLAEWAFPGLDLAPEGGPAARGGRLRQLLLETTDKLNPAQNPGGPRPTNRRYDTLRLTYLEDLTVDEAIKELTVSRRQYFYDLKDAINALAHLLVRTHQIR